jgi:hypothetical protein
MLKFRYKLRLDERVRAKCPRHPRYDPKRKAGTSRAFARPASTYTTSTKPALPWMLRYASLSVAPGRGPLPGSHAEKERRPPGGLTLFGLVEFFLK